MGFTSCIPESWSMRFRVRPNGQVSYADLTCVPVDSIPPLMQVDAVPRTSPSMRIALKIPFA